MEFVASVFKGSRRTLCRGAVLLLALVFMLMLAILSATVMQSSILQLRMAGNDQFLEEAFHRGQAIAWEISLDPDNFFLAAGVGDNNCPVEAQGLDCDRSLLPVIAAAAEDGVELDYRVIRQAPLLWKGFPVREAQDAVSSRNSFDAAIFEINVRIDGSNARLGSTHIAQGIAVRVAAFR